MQKKFDFWCTIGRLCWIESKVSKETAFVNVAKVGAENTAF